MNRIKKIEQTNNKQNSDIYIYPYIYIYIYICTKKKNHQVDSYQMQGEKKKRFCSNLCVFLEETLLYC